MGVTPPPDSDRHQIDAESSPEPAPYMLAGGDPGVRGSVLSDDDAATKSTPTQPAPVIDRLLAPLGARSLVRGRPGMGWLLTEVSPAQLWSAITGALWLDGYNLVLYLTLLGATITDLAYLPLVNYAGFALSVLLLALRPPRGDAKATCVLYALIARGLWLGTVLWPLIAWQLGFDTNVVLIGVFFAILATAFFGNISVAAFMTWTAAVVPREERGRFYMWRNLCAFASVILVLQVVAWAWPQSDATTQSHTELYWLMGLFSVITVLVLLSTLPLAWSPAMPPRAVDAHPHPPLWQAIRSCTGFRRFLAMGALNTTAMACLLPYLPRLLLELGMEGKTYASLQGNAQVPLTLCGIVIAGVALRRIGGSWLVRVTLLITVIGDGLCLLLTATNLIWLAPVCIAAVGLGRGLFSIAWIGRIQELSPPHDTRFPMLHLGVNGVAGLCTGLALMWGVPWLEAQQNSAGDALGPVWTVVLIGVGFRAGSWLISLTPMRR